LGSNTFERSTATGASTVTCQPDVEVNFSGGCFVSLVVVRGDLGPQVSHSWGGAMDTRLDRHVTAGFAALSIAAAIAVSTAPPAAASPVAQSQPPPIPTASSLSPPGLIGQQVAFHVGFVTDFLSTGAQLFARELPIPLALAADVVTGTPVPTAVVQALHDLVDVEVDAGSQLIRFGAEYVSFQAQFVTELVTGQSPTAVAPPTGTALARGPRSGDVTSPPAMIAPMGVTVTTRTDRRHQEPEFHGVRHRVDHPAAKASPSTSKGPGAPKHDHERHDRHRGNDGRHRGR
jgi:hypothetical protein